VQAMRDGSWVGCGGAVVRRRTLRGTAARTVLESPLALAPNGVDHALLLGSIRLRRCGEERGGYHSGRGQAANTLGAVVAPTPAEDAHHVLAEGADGPHHVEVGVRVGESEVVRVVQPRGELRVGRRRG
jgi:hypothetical protein